MPAWQKLRGWATGSRRSPPARAAPPPVAGWGGVLQVPKPHPTHRLRKKDSKSSLNVSTTATHWKASAGASLATRVTEQLPVCPCVPGDRPGRPAPALRPRASTVLQRQEGGLGHTPTSVVVGDEMAQLGPGAK